MKGERRQCQGPAGCTEKDSAVRPAQFSSPTTPTPVSHNILWVLSMKFANVEMVAGHEMHRQSQNLVDSPHEVCKCLDGCGLRDPRADSDPAQADPAQANPTQADSDPLTLHRQTLILPWVYYPNAPLKAKCLSPLPLWLNFCAPSCWQLHSKRALQQALWCWAGAEGCSVHASSSQRVSLARASGGSGSQTLWTHAQLAC